ncbi:hypothetical protein VPHK30_0009 [Vibrio phage K30]|nr:hypothetical protein SIPHO078v2_p0008 [Vibrio phage 14E30.1]
MKDMKMSDIWGWDSIPQNYGHYEAFTFNGVDRKGDFYGFLFCTEEAAEGVAHAVLNHDRLQQENAELRAALEIMVLQFKSEHNCEYEFKVIKLAKNLLNKND